MDYRGWFYCTLDFSDFYESRLCAEVSGSFHVERGKMVILHLLYYLFKVPQKYLRTVWLYGLGISVLKTMSVFLGLLMYAKYADCDPFTTGQVSKNDQLLPYYVMDVAAQVPGLSGLFIAGVVSAALRYI